jgi:hypothetical protein
VAGAGAGKANRMGKRAWLICVLCASVCAAEFAIVRMTPSWQLGMEAALLSALAFLAASVAVIADRLLRGKD